MTAAKGDAKGDARVLNGEDRDASMMDIGEKDRPPGDPPDKPGSWVQKVMGSNAGGMPVPEEIIDDEFVASRLYLEFPNGEEGEPVITIGKEVLEAMNGLWKKCMIVKVLGRNVSIAVLSRKLREIWRPSGSMFVTDLPRQFFMVRFEMEDEYMAALTGGPWRAFGSYLMVRAWSPEFDPARDEIETTPVWVRLSNIPVNFYHKSILMGIAKGLGKPIKVDMTTLNFERARFARVCVEINLKKPLKGSVMVNGERYYVTYEGLLNICPVCGLYGHLSHSCPMGKRVRGDELERARMDVTENVKGQEETQRADGFTPVRSGRRNGGNQRSQMIVAVGGERGERDRGPRESSNVNNPEDIRTLNRFGNLEEEGQSLEVRENKENEANKENLNPLKITRSGIGGGNQERRVFNAGQSRSVNGPNISGRGKKNGQEKAQEVGISRHKHNTPLRPTPGLIFGPTRGELELSVNGKRLRVEKENVGRAGGSVVMVRSGDGSKEQTTQSEDGENRVLSLSSEIGGMSTELVMYETPGEGASGGMIA